ncbi:hypothetical protein [Halobacteriovorax sp. CON-3]|uniref:hypothetical protein n=1 Tax=Halobacteriovorax sp. CON-3 TaxID=3157710 RepID=UPI0037200336
MKKSKYQKDFILFFNNALRYCKGAFVLTIEKDLTKRRRLERFIYENHEYFDIYRGTRGSVRTFKIKQALVEEMGLIKTRLTESNTINGLIDILLVGCFCMEREIPVENVSFKFNTYFEVSNIKIGFCSTSYGLPSRVINDIDLLISLKKPSKKMLDTMPKKEKDLYEKSVCPLALSSFRVALVDTDY